MTPKFSFCHSEWSRGIYTCRKGRFLYFARNVRPGKTTLGNRISQIGRIGIITISTFLLPLLPCRSQTMADEPVNENNITPWTDEDKEAYEGIYFFGFSEGESKLILAIDNEMVNAQVSDYDWVELNDSIADWHPNFENYTNVKIEGNKFYSDQTEGEFVIYDNGKTQLMCLMLDIPPNAYDDEPELGDRSTHNKLEYVNGKYPETKFEIIPFTRLKEMSSAQLKIMRNEIFARYGYIFIEGGAMDKWFRAQSWYTPLFKDVNKFITEIERQNIQNILAEEKSR